jgi:hypothetical protein
MGQPADAYEIVLDPHVLAALISLAIAVIVLLMLVAIPIEKDKK